MKKFFLICLAILLGIQGAAAAEDSGLPEEERINIAVEVTDSSKHADLDTAVTLEKFLIEKLTKKNLVDVLDTEIFDEKSADEPFAEEEITVEKKSSPKNFGELLVFDAVELPAPTDMPENFEQNFYKNFGAKYVVRCEVLALGLTKVDDKTMSAIFGSMGGITSLVGSGSSTTSEKLRTIGASIGLGGFIQTQRTALATVVNVQFIDVEAGQILWQGHFMGQAVKHHNPGKDYEDTLARAYMESVEKTANVVSNRVNKYVDKVIIKGKSDKGFQNPKLSVGGLGLLFK